MKKNHERKKILIPAIIIIVILSSLIVTYRMNKNSIVKNKNILYEDKDVLGKYEWDIRDIRLCSILKIGNEYRLYYSGGNLFYKYSVGIALSNDLFTWQKYEFNPVIDRNESINWEFNGTYESTVINKNGEYLMWYTGMDKSADMKIGFAFSDDGINWEKYNSNPVIAPDEDREWEQGGIFEPAVIYKDGRYFMWYTGMDENANMKIGFAISDDGINWEKSSSNPVLIPGENNIHEKLGVSEPGVIFINNQFIMLYTSYDGADRGISFINVATSDDGINWEKYNGNPVIVPGKGRDWESGGVFEAAMLAENNKIILLYSGRDRYADGRKVKIGLAVSSDGINWEKLERTNLSLTQNDWEY